MGSVPHHQDQAGRFLTLARCDYNAGEYSRAANALARAASHAATAALVHCGQLRQPSRRKLTNTLFLLAHGGSISNGVVRTFRCIYQLPQRLAAAEPGQRPALCRRARNGVARLIRAVAGAIPGHPVSGRGRRPRPRPAPTCVSEIIALPDYREIATAHNLEGAPLARRPDPHGFYGRGETPRPCPCHPVPLSLPDDSAGIELSPLWRRALERTFRTRFPHIIPLHLSTP